MKFLIVGLGSMGKRRIRNLQWLNAGEIIGYDPRQDRRQEAFERYGVTTFESMDAAFEQGPDALIISTPPDRHMGYAMEAVRRGKHFFTEASVIPDDMDNLIVALEEAPGLVAAPSCTLRFHPSVCQIKDLIAEQAVGRILAFTHHCGQYLPDWHPYENIREYYVSKRETGGCREIVPFELTWLLWAMGPVEDIQCMKGKTSSMDADIDDVYQILFRFQTGALGHLLVDVVARHAYRVARFLGETGVIEWNWDDAKVRVFKTPENQWAEFAAPSMDVEKNYIAPEDMYRKEMNAFICAIRGGTPYPYTFREDRQVLSILAAAEAASARVDGSAD